MSDMYSSSVSPTNSTAPRGFVLDLYEQCIVTSTVLREWLLCRKGSFRSAYTPFYKAFVMLFESTRCISAMSTYDGCKADILAWIKRNVSLQNMQANKRIELAQEGLDLFSDWAEQLHHQSVIEFR